MLAEVRDSTPRIWMALYAGSIQEGFSEHQAFNLLQTWILSQNPNGTGPTPLRGRRWVNDVMNHKEGCEGERFVEYLVAGTYGPDKDGWCIPTGDDHGATTYVNVRFCPFCGVELRDIPNADQHGS